MAETVVITGASAGLGRAIARRFAREGAQIGLIARGETGLRATAEEVERLGGRALALPCDVADADAVDAAAERVEAELGPIDIWVNNAMTAVLGEVVDTKPEEFRRVMEVTFLGSVHGAQSALRRMEPRGRGTIIQVGSALGKQGIPLQATYCSAKHAVQGFFESLRTELLHRGSPVHLGIVQMPGMNTTQFSWVRLRVPNEPQPVAPIYQPEVAADAVYWAAGPCPITEYRVRTRDISAIRMSDLISRRRYHELPVYRAYFQPRGLDHILDLGLSSAPSTYRTLILFRAPDASDFTERERTMLETLRPHLRAREARATLMAIVAGRLRVLEERGEIDDLELTTREREIVAGVAAGKTNAQIASELWISPATVKKHLENTYVKLGVGSRAAAASRVQAGANRVLA